MKGIRKDAFFASRSRGRAVRVLADVIDLHEFTLPHPLGVAVAEREVLPRSAMVVGRAVRPVIDVVRIPQREVSSASVIRKTRDGPGFIPRAGA